VRENDGGKTQVAHHFTHGITNSICITSLSGFDVTPVVIQFQHNRFVFASPSSFLLGDLHIYSVHWPLAGDLQQITCSFTAPALDIHVF